jgi:hypothetical protein
VIGGASWLSQTVVGLYEGQLEKWTRRARSNRNEGPDLKGVPALLYAPDV